ncbi:hypothetical protein P152DRAFT_256447 [Eremomyces bilateralis CBS 781.70]|uniref:Uncharacterized protein n=1 Tax=Eremomyces bilateralis CBS 781.70 TaxID=1392243 RepID=A0A6G1FQG7_9PEZI|nr:uncharacterized protein P152DRAFT_256447 [Eremomyces bilateralis CBS 781.70]KAF1808075.1 hypothetical protein P152DRAFT_256447 [Eremomyces bilateralis CBS 781.70]
MAQTGSRTNTPGSHLDGEPAVHANPPLPTIEDVGEDDNAEQEDEATPSERISESLGDPQQDNPIAPRVNKTPITAEDHVLYPAEALNGELFKQLMESNRQLSAAMQALTARGSGGDSQGTHLSSFNARMPSAQAKEYHGKSIIEHFSWTLDCENYFAMNRAFFES